MVKICYCDGHDDSDDHPTDLQAFLITLILAGLASTENGKHNLKLRTKY